MPILFEPSKPIKRAIEANPIPILFEPWKPIKRTIQSNQMLREYFQEGRSDARVEWSHDAFTAADWLAWLVASSAVHRKDETEYGRGLVA